MAKSNQKKIKIDTYSGAFLLILIYFSFINIFVLKSTPEIMAIQFFVLILLFKTARAKDFVKIWIPFIALFFLYEFLRGVADNYSPFYKSTLYLIYNIESFLFGSISTFYLQNTLGENKFLINLGFFFYSMFFYFSFLCAFLIWYFKRTYFKTYTIGFLLVSFVGLAIFFLIPSAPPWMASEKFNLDLKRYLFDNNIIFFKFLGASLWKYFLYANPVAAFPSLHVAWPAYTSLFLIINFRSRWLYFTLIVPIMIGFFVIYTAEHYLLDVVAGWLFAIILIFITRKFSNKIFPS